MTDTVSAKTILISTGASLAGAVVLLFAFVLPAEIGYDPLGTGKLTGITGLSQPAAPIVVAATSGLAGGITPQSEALRTDMREFELGAFEGLEYKYALEEGAAMSFSWSASGPVYYDMHSEPAAGPPGTAESFEIGTAERSDGVYVAPFPGIHGWFWENRSVRPVTVRLTSAGFYTAATEFRPDGTFTHEIPATD